MKTKIAKSHVLHKRKCQFICELSQRTVQTVKCRIYNKKYCDNEMNNKELQNSLEISKLFANNGVKKGFMRKTVQTFKFLNTLFL